MCGIVGFVGDRQAAPILLDGLRRLEYRGYDSSGIAVCGDGALRVKKARGRLQVLSDLTHAGADLPGTLGIGHTRWATHGEPNDINAHPHVSQSGRIAVVHNGIIENYMILKEQLLRKGYTFRSETDTEVVAQLLDYYYDQCNDFFEAVMCTLNAIEGAYALGIVCADYPDRMYAARKDAPLLLGFGEGSNYLASDVTALIRYTRDIVYMDDGELAILSAGGIRIYDRQMRPVEKEHHHIDWEVDAAEKGGYAHFMLKEIMEQPRAIREATAARIQSGRVVLSDLTMTAEEIRSIGKSINSHNDTRRELDKKATSEAVNEILSSDDFRDRKSIVLYNPNWNKGIIGIVASRIVEEFYRPTIILTKSTDGLITGSARSIKEFNIYNGIDHCADLLEHFGGHNYAAGLSLKEENLQAFIDKFEAFVSEKIQDDTTLIPEIDVDMELDLTDITSRFMENLKRFAPFGPGNMAPVFLSRRLVEEGNARIVGERHIKMRVCYRNKSCRPIDAIAFNQKENFSKITSGEDFDMLYHVEENTWNNVTSIQLNVKDIKCSDGF